MPKEPRLAFLYNVRHMYPDAQSEESQLEADFDDQITIDWMLHYLRMIGNILPIEANQEAYLRLYENRENIDLVFNYSEGMYGHDREAQLPAMLEMLRLPYTGSDPLTQAICLHKAKAKEVLEARGIRTAPFQLMETGDEPLAKHITFPAIVKPVSQGSSAGIVDKSVVHDEYELRQQAHWSIATFHQPALVEVFLPGREFSVPMIGNPPETLPFIEADHSSLPEGMAAIDSLEVKWQIEEQSGDDHLVCPANVDQVLREKIENLCRSAWVALGIRDWCRMDVRCDDQGEPCLIEVNSPAGLLPPEVSQTSYFPLAARKRGWDYPSTLEKIVDTAARRNGLR